MKRSSTTFLQTVIVLFGVVVLFVMLWEPRIEGRNAHATNFAIYFKDPLLAYAYIASIPFFAALYQAFKLLGHIGRNEVFSLRSVKALRAIKYCAITILGFVAGGIIWIMLSESEDKPPGIVMGTFAAFISIVIATAAAVFQRLLQNAVDMKSENDLTI